VERALYSASGRHVAQWFIRAVIGRSSRRPFFCARARTIFRCRFANVAAAKAFEIRLPDLTPVAAGKETLIESFYGRCMESIDRSLLEAGLPS
jgi:hypothetical protein